MDDLMNTDWNATAPTANNKAPRPTFGIPVTSATPSSRASPAPSPFVQSLNPPKGPSKAPSPGNDSFANLLSLNSSKNQGNLSLLDRQKQLLQEKSKQEQEQRQRYAQQYGNEQSFWDNLGSGKNTPQPVAQPAARPTQDEDDLLAAFNSAAPVDKSSHFPPPATSAVASGRNTPAAANASSMLANDDDDPFGLGALPQRNGTPSQPPPPAADDDDDILGDLGKPVTAKPAQSEPPRREPPQRQPVDQAFDVESRRSPLPQDPLDRPIAELVDMGFPADRSRVALQETGGDVQSAVGWLLNQAHQESRERSQARGSARASPAPQVRDESRRGRGTSDAALPPWMRQESRQSSAQRNQDNRSPAAEKDVAAYAQEFGTSFLKSANSLWKTGQKRMQKAVAEFQHEGDPNTPKWMRDASADRAPTQSARPSNSRSAPQAQNEQADEMTNEAMLLEARDDRPRPKTRTPEVREQPISRPDSRTRSPAQELPVRGQAQPRFAQQASATQAQRPSTKLSRFDVEEESSQAYVSSARRRRPAPKPEPQPEPEVDLFSPAPVQPPSQPARNTPAPRPAVAKSVTPKPQAPRPQAPPRNIPSISPSALSTSSNHRRAGTDAFKKGDYDAAHNSYSAALTPLPPTHPLIIIVLSNRALTAIKTGDPKAAIADADRALDLIGISKGENEKIDLGNGEGEKDMKEFYGKALMRKAEALENMEKWSDAAKVWRDAVSAGVGGAVSLRARDRCEKAAGGGTNGTAPSAPKPAASRPKPTPAKVPAGRLAQPKRPELSQAQSAEAVRKLREANAAADKADDEKFALSDQVEAKVIAWKGGKSDNLRALLGSLDTVLWADAGWKKVNMSDLIMPNKVKIVYMKAIAKVHPDKIPQSATTEHKMISGSVFSTLNEAWDKFKKDNGL